MCASTLRERYVNFYTDFAFKKLFGTEINKELLISFLNALLQGREEITDLTYLNTEQLGMTEAERKAVFDVYCKTTTGERILIEMQKAEQQYFKDRSIFYSTFPIREQAQKGNWDYRLNRVYTIGVLNFSFDDDDPEYFHHEVQLMDTLTHKVFYDKLTYIYLEMPKFVKKEEELVTLFDKWLYAIRNLATLMERPAALQEAVFTRLFDQAEIAKFNPQDRMNYEESLKDYRDMYSAMKTQLEKGRAEGRAEEKLANARALKDNGVPLDVIARSLGLNDEQMKELSHPPFRFKSQQTKGIPFRPPRATRGCLSACSMFLLGKDALNSGP